jgi:acetoin utilization deacetylase AcuC-like enzyme
VHDLHFVEYLKRVCARVPPGKSIYPYVFPIRNATRPPRELPIRAGYYCIDTFTPLNRDAYMAAKRAVDCSLTAAQAILQGYRLAYALVRPPGHHAERRAFGGFCYFNSTAAGAHYLSAHGKVAVLDIDYHHGNGTQNIFYERADVFTISIHGHPHFAYPYFSGFQDERGTGAGEGFNVNLPIPEEVNGEEYRKVLGKALRRVNKFRPQFLVVAFGLDPAKADPTGSWNLLPQDFEANGRMIGSMRLPTLVVQEGGYRIRSLGANARRFFVGLWHGAHSSSFPSSERIILQSSR